MLASILTANSATIWSSSANRFVQSSINPSLVFARWSRTFGTELIMPKAIIEWRFTSLSFIGWKILENHNFSIVNFLFFISRSKNSTTVKLGVWLGVWGVRRRQAQAARDSFPELWKRKWNKNLHSGRAPPPLKIIISGNFDVKILLLYMQELVEKVTIIGIS